MHGRRGNYFINSTWTTGSVHVQTQPLDSHSGDIEHVVPQSIALHHNKYLKLKKTENKRRSEASPLDIPPVSFSYRHEK